MTKTQSRALAGDIRRTRREVRKMRALLDDMIDYLDLLDARARDDGRRLDFADVCKKLKLKA